MFTPAATAACTASWPEWKKVPSPRFWIRCGWSTKSAMPIHWAPSLPMQVSPVSSPNRSSSISRVMVWQPMPAPTRDPSGAWVLRLWGQPEQKNGERCPAPGAHTDTGMGRRGSGASR